MAHTQGKNVTNYYFCVKALVCARDNSSLMDGSHFIEQRWCLKNSLWSGISALYGKGSYIILNILGITYINIIY